MKFSLLQKLAGKMMKPNSGPSEKSLANDKLRVETVATANDGTKAICRMKAKGHAGYLLTARMITETALTIIDSKENKKDPFEGKGVEGGALTPALVGRRGWPRGWKSMLVRDYDGAL